MLRAFSWNLQNSDHVTILCYEIKSYYSSYEEIDASFDKVWLQTAKASMVESEQIKPFSNFTYVVLVGNVQ